MLSLLVSFLHLGFGPLFSDPLILFVCGCTNGNIIMRELSSENKKIVSYSSTAYDMGLPWENTAGMYVYLKEDRMTALVRVKAKMRYKD